MIKRINHVAVVVPNLNDAMTFWGELLGLTIERTEHIESEGVDAAFLRIGESDIELLEPRVAGTGVARFLEKYGPGMHHICLEVDDILSMLKRLAAANIPLINPTPEKRPDGTQYAFIHPRGSGGVLVELYELPLKAAT